MSLDVATTQSPIHVKQTHQFPAGDLDQLGRTPIWEVKAKLIWWLQLRRCGCYPRQTCWMFSVARVKERCTRTAGGKLAALINKSQERAQIGAVSGNWKITDSGGLCCISYQAIRVETVTAEFNFRDGKLKFLCTEGDFFFFFFFCVY